MSTPGTCSRSRRSSSSRVRCPTSMAGAASSSSGSSVSDSRVCCAASRRIWSSSSCRASCRARPAPSWYRGHSPCSQPLSAAKPRDAPTACGPRPRRRRQSSDRSSAASLSTRSRGASRSSSTCRLSCLRSGRPLSMSRRAATRTRPGASTGSAPRWWPSRSVGSASARPTVSSASGAIRWRMSRLLPASSRPSRSRS